MRDQLEAKLARFEELERAMVDPAVLGDQQRLSATAREHGTLAKLALRYRQFTTLERQIAEHREMIAGDDADLRGLAEAELPEPKFDRESNATLGTKCKRRICAAAAIVNSAICSAVGSSLT